MKIKQDLTNVNASSGNGEAIVYIVIHETGNYDDSDEGNANYFRDENRYASAHYFVDEDSITQVVPDNMAAWHCGDGNGKYGITNQNSIGIEMCKDKGGINEATVSATLQLIKSLTEKYGVSIENVVRHYDASRKMCPAVWSSNNWARWHIFKEQLKNLIEKGTSEMDEKRIREIIKEETKAPSEFGEGYDESDWAYKESERFNTRLYELDPQIKRLSETRLQDDMKRGEVLVVANIIMDYVDKKNEETNKKLDVILEQLKALDK